MTQPAVLTLSEEQNLRPDIRAKALLFADPASLQLLQQARRIAPSHAPVLIQGETGTGKELLARHIHTESGRKGPFVAVNGAAITESLAEAEFFGFEAGAFTGATGRREGWFETAQGGTLFLDEIGDLPLSLQVKLLRVLQEGEIVRVGGRRAIPIDVRVVTATHVDLAGAIAAGRFRQDLFYRLNILGLRIPPLRERPGDILPLARHFLERHALSHGLDVPLLTPATEIRLVGHRWPGNIRELENTLLRAALHADSGVIEADQLQLHGDAGDACMPGAAAPSGNSQNNPDSLWHDIGTSLRQLLDHEPDELWARWEQLLLESTLTRHRYNQVQSASRLGISRHALRTLMKRHQLLPGNPRETEAISA